MHQYKMRQKVIIILVLCLGCAVNSFAIELYPFKKDSEKKRFQHLLQNLRCLVCENQSLLDSQAKIAGSLRTVIFDKIKQGESNQKILQYLERRYGDFISYTPKLEPRTYFLWFMPFVGLLIGLSFVFKRAYLKRI